MAYTLGFDNDVFISYSRRDNRDSEWVDHFHKALHDALIQKLNHDDISVWRDKKLKPNTFFNRKIKKEVGNSAVFLALLSRNYLKSEYCLKELDWFWSGTKGVGVSIGEESRIVNVQINNIHYNILPLQLQGTSGIAMHNAPMGSDEDGEFFDHETREFREGVRKIARTIVDTLKEFQVVGQSEETIAPGNNERKEPIGRELKDQLAAVIYADEVFEENSPGDQLLVKRIFQALTETGPENRKNLRPQLLSKLESITDASGTRLRNVIDKFCKGTHAFLVVSTEVPGGDLLVNISHESLMHKWKRLEQWMHEEAKSADIYRRLARSAQLNRAGERNFYRDPALQIALAWKDKKKLNKEWALQYNKGYDEAMAFLEESRVAKEQEERIEKRNRKLRILLYLSITFITFMYILIQYSTFYAEFSAPHRENLQQEIVITRGFNPFNERITTGYFKKDVRDQQSINKLTAGFKISFLDRNNWKVLANELAPVSDGEFLYRTGHIDSGIGKLIEAIDKSDVKIFKGESLNKLVNLATFDNRVIGALVESLKNKDYKIQWHAAEALGRIGLLNNQVIGGLKDALDDKEWLVRYHAAKALSIMEIFDSRIVDVMLETPGYTDPFRKCTASLILGEINHQDNRVYDKLIESLKNKKIMIHLRAKDAIKKIENINDYLIDGLIAVSKDKKYKYRNRIVKVIGEIAPSVPRVIAVLRAILQDDDMLVRFQAAEALVKIGKHDNVVIDALMGILEKKESDPWCDVVKTLGLIAKPNRLIVETIIKSFHDNELRYWDCAANALVKIGKLDKSIIKRLKTLLKDNSRDIRDRAAIVLGKIGVSGTPVIELLIAILNDSNSESWRRAPKALGKIGSSDSRVIDALLKVFDHNDTGMQEKVADALGKIRTSHKHVIDRLIPVVHMGAIEVRKKVIDTLGKIGHSDERTLETLVEILADKNESIQRKALFAIGELLHDKKEVELIDLLKHQKSGYRKAGAYALARKESTSQKTITRIKKLKEDHKHPWVRLGAWRAYKLIQKRDQFIKTAQQQIKKADTHVKNKEFPKAENLYQEAFNRLKGILPLAHGTAARIKFQQARCSAYQKKVLSTLTFLEQAFQLNPQLRKDLKEEITKNIGQWHLIKDNWYLDGVLLSMHGKK